MSAKSEVEVEHILHSVAYRHHLCADPLNGHGYRVAVLQALTAVAPRTRCLAAWFDAVHRFRALGFVLTRTYAAEGFTTIRQWLLHQFEHRGRVPTLVTEGLSYIRELVRWCREDRLVMDHVLHTRLILNLTTMVSYLDRQNLYRSSFSPEFSKRDGVVSEWVLSAERCVDFDEAVLQCDAYLEEVLTTMRREIPTRPTFSILYRLIDYYFATDNVEKMLAVMEDSVSYGLPVAESSTAKLMQLACALNDPAVPQLFIRWRVSLPQCVIATPDISRLLFYYARSGGGRPCPVCGEPYNHRNVGVYVWLETPPHQRRCPALVLGRKQKGELEEDQALPQNRNWSEQAFGLWELSRQRAIVWGPVEWRGFLLCCMFPPTAAAETRALGISPVEAQHSPARGMEAKALLDAHLPVEQMDDFLRATYMRLLRHHRPQLAAATTREWEEKSIRLSPMVLQEALMAATSIEGDEEAAPGQRYRDIQHIWRIIKEKDSYITPFTKRHVEARRGLLISRGSGPSAASTTRSDTSCGGHTANSSFKEQELLQEIIAFSPQRLSLLDMKDSASDFALGVTRKNVFIT